MSGQLPCEICQRVGQVRRDENHRHTGGRSASRSLIHRSIDSCLKRQSAAILNAGITGHFNSL
jgi:hypothetical protein